MKKILLPVIFVLILAIAFPVSAKSPVFIQIDEKEVEQVLDMFSAFSAGGYFHTADVHSIGGFDVGLRGVAVFIPSKYKDMVGHPFENVDFVAMPFLHGSLGLPLGFEVTGRVFRYPIGGGETDDAVTLFGVGLKKGLLQLPALPKVAVMAIYNGFYVPDDYAFGAVNSMSLKGIVSQDLLSLFEVYIGAGVDRTNLDLELGSTKESYSSTTFHGTAGLVINLPLLHVNADYTLGEFKGFNLGAGINFR